MKDVSRRVARQTVRLLKYLTTSGMTIRRLYISKDGRSSYIKAKYHGTKFIVRLSDHHAKGGRLKNGTHRNNFYAVPSSWTWRQIRVKVRHFIAHHLIDTNTNT